MKKPNVLLILADDLGVQTGCYGNTTARTPNIDRLAAEGVLFERAYATSSICSPSRASMFTGLYPHQHGLLGMPWGYRVLAGAPRLPGLLQEVGYRPELISNVDLLPAIAELCGARQPAGLPGASFAGLLQPGQVEWRDSLLCEYHGNQTADYYPMRTVRNDRYKLILNLLCERPNPVVPYLKKPYNNLLPFEEESLVGTETMAAFETFAHPPREELYDLETDPIEFKNLAGETGYESILNDLRRDLQAWRETTCDPYLDPEYLEQMTAYYDGGAAEQERRGARYSYQEGILFNVDMQVLYPEGILQKFV